MPIIELAIVLSDSRHKGYVSCWVVQRLQHFALGTDLQQSSSILAPCIHALSPMTDATAVLNN